MHRRRAHNHCRAASGGLSGVGIYPKHPFKIVIFPFFLPFPPFFLLSSFYLARVKKGSSAPACTRISDIIEERPACSES